MLKVKYYDNLVLNKCTLRYSDRNSEKNAKATLVMQYFYEKNKAVSFQLQIDTSGHLSIRTREDWIPEEVLSWLFDKINFEAIRLEVINTILFSQQVKYSDLIDIVKSVIRRMYDFNCQEYCSNYNQVIDEFLNLYKDQYLFKAVEPVYYSDFVSSIVNNTEMPKEEQIEHIAVTFANNTVAHKVNLLGRALYKYVHNSQDNAKE